MENDPKTCADFLYHAISFEQVALFELQKEAQAIYLPPQRRWPTHQRPQEQIRSDTAQTHPTPAALQQAVTSQPAVPVSNAQKPLSKGQVFENSNNRGSYSHYSGCHICGSLEHYARNCRERQDFEQWRH
ncbi:unnamed protein product [Didymodactylos carnosus]|uniref:CCHC-type domain-containing protein n=1 Tax=Didymodactylos carnosus TaxID=1234261 RepID=A0A814VLC1_9BILA|nr:unnamed protein product [Didymodactylos carnosus]CAF3953867.1 unnamed protein product [Didymodactylos carnosus]CAF4177104.1 unnamed protein product [Didymodactylos carnosus]